jgi:hypothetical protein
MVAATGGGLGIIHPSTNRAIWLQASDRLGVLSICLRTVWRLCKAHAFRRQGYLSLYTIQLG